MIRLVRWLFRQPAKKKRGKVTVERVSGYHKAESFWMLFNRIVGLDGGTIGFNRLLTLLADESHTYRGLEQRLYLMSRSGLVKIYGKRGSRRVRLNTALRGEAAYEYFNRWMAEQGRRKPMPDTAQRVLEAA